MKRIIVIAALAISLAAMSCNSKKAYQIDIGWAANVTKIYYEYLTTNNYKDALSLVDYKDNTDKNIKLNWLINHKKDYHISIHVNERYTEYITTLNVPKNFILEIDYCKKLKQYRIITLYTRKLNGKEQQLNDFLFLKKINGTYKIVCIESNDELVKNRSSQNQIDINSYSDFIVLYKE